ncbi:uncharacterized protein TrAFT101_005628 [Trichoderma asperellum]|uniref:uncharacterized protein n=1 Tax=Trichoderma asperellum TaxID=101201 RepID=UPI00332F8E53|nr:hypothetical protein TrAFT101_005628 [Trichoderma asperellum]
MQCKVRAIAIRCNSSVPAAWANSQRRKAFGACGGCGEEEKGKCNEHAHSAAQFCKSRPVLGPFRSIEK